MSSLARPSFEFGPFRLDLLERVLLRDGKAVPLAPKVFETLVVLVENSGHILEKDELLKRLWPDSYVEESNLAQNIFQLRRALETEGSGKQFIDTIPKRGYRFTAEVKRTEFIPTSSQQHTPASIKHEPGNITIKSLAVLPFQSLTSARCDEHLGLGMAHETIIKLSSLRRFVVLPTRAVFKCAEGDFDSLAVGRRLGVGAVLEGTIQRIEDHVRVSVRLLSVDDSLTLWAERFDENFTDIFALQDSISEQVVSALSLQITGDEQRHLRKRHTTSTEAYQTYLMGLFFWNKRSGDGLNKAVEHFERAIEQDSDYALAYAGLADCYFLIAHGESDPLIRKQAFERSRSSALTAIRLDPSVAEAHAALASVKVKHDRDLAGAERSFEEAIAADPNCAVAYSRYTYFLAAMGRLKESLGMMRRAQELDPLSPDMNTSLASILYFARQYDEAIQFCQRALVLEPNFYEALLWLGLSYVQKGMYQEAIGELQKANETSDEQVEALELLGYLFATLGKRDKARRILKELQTDPKRAKTRSYNIALIHAALAEKTKAFEWLEKPFVNWTERLRMLRLDPRMDVLKDDSRFVSMLQNSMAGSTVVQFPSRLTMKLGRSAQRI
jgi:DNA-binding winged helix-turn-helix (wHTH) protein/Tfp pilus assembly protein PilF